MAKKSARILIGLRCSSCKRQNYIISKNKVEHSEGLKFKKYCRFCKKHTLHQESKKLD
jgi:large subunit ribosomal protein L33